MRPSRPFPPFHRFPLFPLFLLLLLLSACGGAATTAAPPASAPASAAAKAASTVPPTVVPPPGAPAAPVRTATRPAPTPTRAASAAVPKTVDGLPTITWDKLPREARETLALIDRGGPFPYRQDGQTFQNRERLLPARPSDYYKEYTVETPGSPDRGARRIIGGAGGELYYTDDHYDSFKRIVRP